MDTVKILMSILLILILITINGCNEQWGECKPTYPSGPDFKGHLDYQWERLNQSYKAMVFNEYYMKIKCLDGTSPEEIIVYKRKSFMIEDAGYTEYIYYCKADNQSVVVQQHAFNAPFDVYQGKPCK